MIAHLAARQLTEEQLHLISDLCEVGSKPCEILALIKRQYPEALVTSKDIYNKWDAL